MSGEPLTAQSIVQKKKIRDVCTAWGGAYPDTTPTASPRAFPASCHKTCNVPPYGSRLLFFQVSESSPCRVHTFIASAIDDGHQADLGPPNWSLTPKPLHAGTASSTVSYAMAPPIASI